MNFLILSLATLTIAVVTVLVENFVYPFIMNKLHKRRILKSEFTTSLFKQSDNYIKAIHRNNSDMRIDDVLAGDCNNIDIWKTIIEKLGEM